MTQRLDDHRVEVTHKENVICISPLEAHLTGEVWVRKLRRVTGDEMDRLDKPLLILDLGAVEHMSSAILGELIGINRRVVRRGGRMRLAALRPEVEEILAITRLNQSFEIRKDVAAALKNFKPTED